MTISYADIIETIQSGGDPSNIESLRFSSGKTVDKYYGWSISQLQSFARHIQKHFAVSNGIPDLHYLSQRLWETGILDNKLLATALEEPLKVTVAQINSQSATIYDQELLDYYVKKIVTKTPFATETFEKWSQSNNELLQRGAWEIITGLASRAGPSNDAFFEEKLTQIEIKLHFMPDIVKEAAAWTFIEIGTRSFRLHAIALVKAQNIRKISSDTPHITIPNIFGYLSGPKGAKRLKQRSLGVT